MSPAEELRAAAARMRELAEKATPGHWVSATGRGKLGVVGVPGPSGPGSGIAVAVSATAGNVKTANAKHIAAWHPAVALAVADWLLTVENEMDVEAHRFESGDFPYTWTAALAVARAFLGGAS